MADEDDGLGMDQALGDSLIVGVFFRNSFALAVGFLAVDEVVLKPKGTVRLDGPIALRQASAHVVIDERAMMIDGDDHPPGPVGPGGFPQRSSIPPAAEALLVQLAQGSAGRGQFIWLDFDFRYLSKGISK